MFNFGFFELILLFIIIVVFVGPEQLPTVAKNLLKLLNSWRQTTEKVTESVTEPLNDIKKQVNKSINESRESLLKQADEIKEKTSTDKN
ncbi:MAG: twin-arginine translocase TatA/TatE family subunit [Bdellovibrionales bacterium]|nr:twin-arginine translocase TatA/TatE family subunit [Bdellovibrionales bacterium]